MFELYEQNIGMMSPMIADALLEAEEMYPEEWIEDAIEEAVVQNKRSWRYISRILERWELEGRGLARVSEESAANSLIDGTKAGGANRSTESWLQGLKSTDR